jgi:hypothetical protein
MFTTILIVLGVLSAIIGTIVSYKNAKGTELGKKFLRIAVGDEQAEYVLKVNIHVIATHYWMKNMSALPA